MRLPLIIAILLSTSVTQAQIGYPVSLMGQRPMMPYNSLVNDSIPSKKWFVTSYTGVSTSFMAFRGGSATMLSIPVGIQLNRHLTNNLFAFGAITAAPTYTNFNGSYLAPNTGNPGFANGFSSPNKLNLYTRAEMGLMYVNDAKTFSISGSIGVERRNYPSFIPLQQHPTMSQGVAPRQ